jgi:hypothetical protein
VAVRSKNDRGSNSGWRAGTVARVCGGAALAGYFWVAVNDDCFVSAPAVA